MLAKKYWERRTPVEAILLTNDNLQEAAKWCNGTVDSYRPLYFPPSSFVIIPGPPAVNAYVDSYLIKHVSGRFEVLDIEEFETIYERKVSIEWTNSKKEEPDVVL